MELLKILTTEPVLISSLAVGDLVSHKGQVIELQAPVETLPGQLAFSYKVVGPLVEFKRPQRGDPLGDFVRGFSTDHLNKVTI